jgi:hypothetical protein
MSGARMTFDVWARLPANATAYEGDGFILVDPEYPALYPRTSSAGAFVKGTVNARVYPAGLGEGADVPQNDLLRALLKKFKNRYIYRGTDKAEVETGGVTYAVYFYGVDAALPPARLPFTDDRVLLSPYYSVPTLSGRVYKDRETAEFFAAHYYTHGKYTRDCGVNYKIYCGRELSQTETAAAIKGIYDINGYVEQYATYYYGGLPETGDIYIRPFKIYVADEQ